MQFFRKLIEFSLVAVAIALLISNVGCSSALTGAATNTATAAAATAAPILVTVSDAPLANILSAQVTLSAITLSTGASGSSVSVLAKPVNIELSSLAGIQEPVELQNIAAGTYTSVTATVSAAQVTYLNASGVVTTGVATISQPTLTVALSPSLAVVSTGEVHLDLGFNLATSFDLTGTTLTFTPAMSTAAAAVESQIGGDRQVEVTGSVVSISSTSIVVQSSDSGQQFTYTINGSTVLPVSVTTASIATGSIVHVQGQIQTDGTLLALSITPQTASTQTGSEGNGSNGSNGSGGGQGLIASVTTSAGQVTGFTLAARDHFDNSTASTIAVTLSSATVYAIDQDALALGLTATQFTNAELFPGQSVTVTGTNTSGTVAATQVTLDSESLSGTLAALPSGTSPNLSFTLTLAAGSYLTTYESLTALNAVTETNTQYDHQLTASAFAALPAATAVEVNGYLLKTAPGSFTLYTANAGQVQAAQTPQ
jgi:hypothetical protein